ncbi:cupin domain-containing protein [Roseomonas sp. WA12]
MTVHSNLPGFISRSEDRQWLEFGGERVSIRLASKHTGGSCSIVEGVLAPLSGPPLHIHQHEDEIVQVLEGELRFMLGKEVFDVAAGSYVFIPRGMAHTWRNLTDTTVRAVGFFSPGGAEAIFAQFADCGSEDLAALANVHGTIFVGPQIGS